MFSFHDLPQSPTEAAVELARRGFKVFPCNADPSSQKKKRPLTNHGFKDASDVERIVRGRFQSNPGALIGLPTGRVNGIIVLDIDSAEGHGCDGFTSLDVLAEHGFTVPGSPIMVRTPSGGLHIYFRCPPTEINSRSGIAPGIDIRGEGGYVICPPSRYLNGSGWEVDNG